MIDNARDFLDAVSGYANSPTTGGLPSADKGVRLGTIDPNYTSGPARVLFDGETVISKRGYSWASGYSPMNGDRVYLVPVGQTYLIGGSVTSTLAYPRQLPATLINGWVTYEPVNFPGARFTKSPSGVVKMSGMIKSGSMSVQKILRLPREFWPSKPMMFPAFSNSVYGVVNISVDGWLGWYGYVSNAWLSLENITYTTEKLNWIDLPMNTGNWQAGADYYGALGQPQAAKDSYGRIWIRGCAKGIATDGLAICTLPSDMRPQFTQWMPTSCYANSKPDALGLVTINRTTGNIEYRTGTRDNFSLYLTGMMTPVNGTPWTTATYQNGWTNNDATNFGPAQYWKDPDGMVHIRGLVKGTTAGTTIFTLPAGYRPSNTLLRATAALNAPGRVDILPDGQVRHNIGSLTWVSLDNITFAPEQ